MLIRQWVGPQQEPGKGEVTVTSARRAHHSFHAGKRSPAHECDLLRTGQGQDSPLDPGSLQAARPCALQQTGHSKTGFSERREPSRIEEAESVSLRQERDWYLG